MWTITEQEAKTLVKWYKEGVVGENKALKITINGVELFNATVPAGKEFKGTLEIKGVLENV